MLYYLLDYSFCLFYFSTVLVDYTIIIISLSIFWMCSLILSQLLSTVIDRIVIYCFFVFDIYLQENW